jgi:hypothetical protein
MDSIFGEDFIDNLGTYEICELKLAKNLADEIVDPVNSYNYLMRVVSNQRHRPYTGDLMDEIHIYYLLKTIPIYNKCICDEIASRDISD